MARNRGAQTVDESAVATLDAPVETAADTPDTATPANGNGAETPAETQKGYAEYKLAGDIPQALNGKLIRTPEKYTVADFAALVQDGDEKHIVSLAQAQFDIIIQRHIRNAANSEDVAKMLTAGDVDGAVTHIQGLADKYVYGSRPASSGGDASARKAKSTVSKLRAAAAADPDLAARLAALGVEM